MMATTHALAGLAVAAAASVLAPEAALHAAVAGVVGGVVPDLDLYAGHRRTLHYPVYGSLAAALAVVVAALAPSAWTVAAAVFLVAFALHALSDGLGGGLELRPWEGTSEEAVYSHYHRRWWRPRRLVRYDGAPEDLALAALVAVPGVLTFDARVDTFVYGALALSAAYVLVRKPMVAVAEWLVDRIPRPILARIPERFVEDVT